MQVERSAQAGLINMMVLPEKRERTRFSRSSVQSRECESPEMEEEAEEEEEEEGGEVRKLGSRASAGALQRRSLAIGLASASPACLT